MSLLKEKTAQAEVFVQEPDPHERQLKVYAEVVRTTFRLQDEAVGAQAHAKRIPGPGVESTIQTESVFMRS
jgi:hypothetical protein